jgi:hypothetical protein
MGAPDLPGNWAKALTKQILSAGTDPDIAAHFRSSVTFNVDSRADLHRRAAPTLDRPMQRRTSSRLAWVGGDLNLARAVCPTPRCGVIDPTSAIART